MKSLIICFAVSGFLCAGLCQKLPTADEALAKINEIVDIPGLKNLDLKGLNMSMLPFNEAENLLKKKCEKNGGPNAYETAKAAGSNVVNCVKDLVDLNVLKQEMDAARPTGDLDEVFKKYCHKKPILKGCVTNFTDAIEPCLDPVERENKKIVLNITEKILNFVCFKEGDRIALFIAAKGPECFQAKTQAIMDCGNSTYGKYSKDLPMNPEQGLAGLTTSLSGIKDLPSLVFDQKTCTDMNTLQGCVVNALEGCEDPTPANLLDSIFNYIKKVTPCQKMLSPQA
ncbi:27 kDa glycoprotein-like [Phymastichus coffea]|uniref:27 kDa glycoprotein-like n=1 Tax=Phymastichus coffea TaxID=108790 RepID=UPI00273BBFF4|nr:27 kDa glycoprotein-like [Phymastichus coffea]